MLNKNDFKVFNTITLFWLLLGWLAFVLTLSGIFYWWLLASFIAITVALGRRFLLKPLLQISKIFLAVNIFIFLFIAVLSVYTSPTIFSGRDQGALSEAAIWLSKNNQLHFSNSVSADFFAINSAPEKKMSDCLAEKNIVAQEKYSLTENINRFYCHTASAGKALNFPGFFYTPAGDLVTQFPLVYISWLAFFYSFFGLSGFIIANAILFYIFLLSIFLLSYKLTSSTQKESLRSLYIPALTLLATATSFSFSWFFKFTLTENMALGLLFLGILQMVVLTKEKLTNLSGKKLELLILLMSFGLLIFTRIEGLAFFALAIIVLMFFQNTATYFRRNFFTILFPALLIIILFFIWNAIIDVYFYKAIFKALFKDFGVDTLASTPSYLPSTSNQLKIFTTYGIITPLVLGFFSIIYFLKNRDYKKLIPFFIVAPSFLYIFSPQITPDHPWMLRRFVFAVLPILILYTTTLLSDLLKNKRDMATRSYEIIVIIFILLNLPAFTHFITYIPSKNLFAETKKISQHFGENDLVLIDPQTSGDTYAMIDMPMNSILDKNSVYFFNLNDFNEINKQKYDKIYLLSPADKIADYQKSILGDRLIFVENYSIETNILVTDSTKIYLPEKRSIKTPGAIFEITK